MQQEVLPLLTLQKMITKFRTKSADINNDLNDVEQNLIKVNQSYAIPDTVKDNHARIVNLYLNDIKQLRYGSEIKRWTRLPYDKILGMFYTIVYDNDLDAELVNVIIEPLRDVLALHAIKNIPLEFLVTIAVKIEALINNIQIYLQNNVKFLNHEMDKESIEESDRNIDERLVILNDIVTIADTFVDLRLYKLL